MKLGFGYKNGARVPLAQELCRDGGLGFKSHTDDDSFVHFV
jgi:hypothetical protein